MKEGVLLRVFTATPVSVVSFYDDDDLPKRPKLMTDFEGSDIQETHFTYIIST